MNVALYARVSTAKQFDKDLSIPDQLKQMREWSRANGHIIVAEYIEGGATATDDRRPEFKMMIEHAASLPCPYQAVIVHSRSRFFRDLFEFLSYERKLKRLGCRVISITQQTADDPAGQMASQIFSLFDEYSSKENGKHTLRAMKENARRGYFNGSRPCFGYQAVECFMDGDKSKKKKRAEINHTEAGVVRHIFGYYLNGHSGKEMGAKEIAQYLNNQGISLRGTQWNKSRVHEVLANRAYVGEYYFNKRENKSNCLKPESEWILLNVEPIIDSVMFDTVRARRESRTPAKIAPRVLNSPNLLTGIIKCDICNAAMTSATGKGGRYRYYKCNTRISKGNHLCTTPILPMEKIDSLVMETVLEKVLTPSRLKILLAELRKRQKSKFSNQDELSKPLHKELEQVQSGTVRLYEAVEKGLLPLDESLQERIQQLKIRKEEVVFKLTAMKNRNVSPLESISPGKLDLFSKAIRNV
ncbi:MAG: recombinase family protein, partial [Gallionella sp.]|nr:recombinase family protein [Gallionella sp.]